MNYRWIKIIFIACILPSCAFSVHAVHTSDFEVPTGKNPKIVQAESEQFAILGFVFDTRYVDIAYESLGQQCRGGTIDGITTKYSTDLGFFSWTNRIKMQGICHR